MRCWVVVVALAVLACADAARAAPSETRRPDVSMPLEGSVTPPDWLRRPTGEEMANYYPQVAQMLSLDGHAVITCEVTVQGATANCTVKSETPEGMGFGQAAISLADFFRMKPLTVDGVPVAGSKVTIPIGFLVPRADDGAGPIPAPDTQTAPSSRALELARRIVGVNFSTDAMNTYVARTREAIGAKFANLSLTEQEQAGIDDYMAALAAAMPELAEIRARHFAEQLSEPDLAAVDAFLESGAGRAYAAAANDSQSSVADMTRLWAGVRKDASRAYCQKYACAPPRPEGSPPAPS